MSKAIERGGDRISKRIYEKSESIMQATTPLEEPVHVRAQIGILGRVLTRTKQIPSVIKSSVHVTSNVTPAAPKGTQTGFLRSRIDFARSIWLHHRWPHIDGGGYW